MMLQHEQWMTERSTAWPFRWAFRWGIMIPALFFASGCMTDKVGEGVPRVVETSSASKASALLPDSAEFWIRHGEALRQYGEQGLPNAARRYAQAASAFREALVLDPSNVDAAQQLASVLMRTGETEIAAAVVRQALRQNPSDAVLYGRRGYVLRYAGYLEQSIAAYGQSAALDSSFENVIRAHDQTAKALIYQGQYNEALSIYVDMRAMHQQRGTALRGKTAFYEGLAHLYLGNESRARAYFAEAQQKSQATLWGMFAEAYDLLVAGDREALAALASRLETENVADGERRYRLVHFYASLGEIEKAVMHFEAAVAAGNFNYPYFAGDPLLASLRADSRFQSVLMQAKRRHDRFQD